MAKRICWLALTSILLLIACLANFDACANGVLSLNQLVTRIRFFDGLNVRVRGYLTAYSSPLGLNFVLTDGELSIGVKPVNVDLTRWLGCEVELYGTVNSNSMKLEVLAVSSPVEYAAPKFESSIAVSLEHSPLGGQPTYVIPVKFPDVAPSKNITEIMAVVEEAANEYYPKVSYNLTWFNCKFIDNWLLMPRNMSYYAADNDTTRDDLIKDAIALADSFINYTRYYRIIIVHAGGDEALTHISSDIWSYAALGELLISTDDGSVKISVAVVSEFDPLGVYVHEMGHMLGLPELYDVDHVEEFMGKWDVMAKGMWNGRFPGSSPAHPSSACKISLGWLDPDSIVEVEYESFITVTINPLESESGVRVVKIPVTPEAYYLIEVRRKVDYDLHLPGEGVLIIFVNESISSGDGPARIIDSKPKTATLDDAFFTVGSSWSDANYNITIRIESQVGSAYIVSIFYGDKVIIDEAEVSRSRADVNSTQYVRFHAKWASSGENASRIELEINGTLCTTDDEGWATVTVNSSKVGKQTWMVTAAYIDEIPIALIVEAENPSIIWDEVVITLVVPPEKLRVSINSNATILYDAKYAYDDSPFEGKVYLNGSTISSILGVRWFKVYRIIDYKYNLTAFKSNVVKVIFDALKVEVQVDKQLYNPGDVFEVKVKLTYASDGTPIVGGRVKLNGNQLSTEIGGIATFNVRAPNCTCEFTLHIEGVSDGKSVDVAYNHENLTLYATAIVIDRISPRNVRVEIGKPIRVDFHAIWAHNYTSASNVEMWIADRKLVTGSDGWASIEMVMSRITKVDLDVEKVAAPEGITAFRQPIPAYIIWDKLNINIETYTLTPGSIKFIVKISYEYDGSPVKNANVMINRFKAAKVNAGTYSLVLDSWDLTLTVEVLVEVEGFQPVIKVVEVIAIGNIVFYSVSLTLIGLIILYFMREFKIIKRLPRIRSRIRISRDAASSP